MIFGLRFTNDSGQVAQFSIDTEKDQLFFRVAKNGTWTQWKRADVDRKADGTLNEVVDKANTAVRASKADKFTNPVTVTFTGGATGKMKLDGSKETLDVRLDVSGALNDALTGNGIIKNMVDTAVSEAIASHVWKYHPRDEGNK